MKVLRSLVAGLAALVISSTALAVETLSLRYESVPVLTLLQSTYRDILRIPYALDGSVLGNKARVSIDLPELPADQLQPTVDAFLEQAGIFKSFLPGGQVVFTSQRQAVRANPSLDGKLLEADYDADLPGVPADLFDSASSLTQPPLATLENVQFYKPRNRPAAELQQLANLLLGSSLPAISGSVLLGGADLDRLEQVLYAIEQLDQTPGQVFARALVVEFTDTSTTGSTFEAAIQALSGKLDIRVGSLLSPAENLVKVTFGDFSALVSAVSGDSRFSVVSSPTLRVADGSTGRVSVGQEVPTLSSTMLDNQGNAQQSISYRSSGVILELKPRLYRDRIEMDLLQQISDFAQNRTSGIDSPTLSKRELRSVVSMKSGEMIILGGLNSKKSSQSERGLSFLPRFFSSKSSEKTTSEVLIFLQVEV